MREQKCTWPECDAVADYEIDAHVTGGQKIGDTAYLCEKHLREFLDGVTKKAAQSGSGEV